MNVSAYVDLSALGKIIYARREAGAIATVTVQLFVTKGKIRQEEADFIISTFP